MNEEIKKATKAILSDLHDAGKRYGEDIGYAKDDILYEMRLNALTDAWAKIDQKLKEQYLLGAKDMWEAVDKEAWLVKTKQTYPYADMEERLELMTECMTTKAQQFIDSLEKGTTNE